jgi:hypothetical protein
MRRIWRAAAGAVGGELTLVHLDQVLGLVARTIEGVVYVLGRTGGEAGDDVADVEAEGASLDAGTGASRLRPGPGPIHRLGIAAQHGRASARRVQISSATISTARSSVPLPESPNTKSILRRRRHARPIGFVAAAAQLAIRMKENSAPPL